MAWLTGWYRRKPKLVKGSTAGAQTDYQLKLTIYKGSGTDTVNTIYLGGYVNDDFSDLRFTSSDETTLLPYWIESYISGVSAIVWIKIDSIPADPFSKFIYIYYNNPLATTASNYFNTFDILGNGSDGSLTVTTPSTVVNAYAYLTGNGNIGSYTITINSGTGFSNGDEILIIQTQNYSGGISGAYELRKISSGGGTTTLTLDTPLKNSYVSGVFSVYVAGCTGQQNANVTQIVRVPQYTNVTINSGASITATAWNGYNGGIVAFKANGTVTIASGGSINTTAKGFRCGPGCCVAIGSINGCQGEDYTGTGAYIQSAKASGGGGAGKLCNNQHTAGGGGGSYATAGANGYIEGSCTPGIGCTAIFGSYDLSVLFFGGAAGVGYAGPAGNSSGGIIFIGANTLNNSGTTTSNGSIPGGTISPSGGGAGGSISVTASTLTTGNNITAIGGAGGLGGGTGGNGRIRLSYNSITGTSNPTAYTTGFDTEHNRKYASPEPIWDQSSSEQTYTANLTVSSTPTGAEIFLAPTGSPLVDQGVITTSWFVINPGTYTILLTKAGYQDYIEIIVLSSNQNAIVQGNLISITGNLDISSTPYGAEIFLAPTGSPLVDQGIDTPNIISLSPGIYDYKLSLTDYYDATGSFTITAGLTTTLNIPLTLLPCPIVPKYSGNTVTLKATPKDGTGPYYVEFRKNGVDIDPARLSGLSNPILSAPEDILITRVYTLDDLDISSASLGTIDFSVYMEDSCPTGVNTCTETCTINIGCLAPVCNFTIT